MSDPLVLSLAELLAALPDDVATEPDDDLAQLRNDIAEAVRDARGEGTVPADTAALMRQGAAFVQEIDTERQNRAALASASTAEADAALAAIGDGQPALVASAGAARRAARVPVRHRPRARSSSVIMRAAAADGAGAIYPNEEAVADAMFATAEQARHGGVDGEHVIVASVDWSSAYGDAPQLRGSHSSADNGAVLARVAHEFTRRNRERGALVASGGVPGPAEPRYQVPTFGSVSRSLRDALPSILAARGEITYNMAPTIEDVLADTGAGAIGAVTSAQDATGATKNVQEIGAPTPRTVTVEAQTLRVQHGNFADRFLPEYRAAWMENAQVRFARHNEARRFNDIASASTHMTDTPAKFGAWRDLKRCILGLTEELEDRLRDPNLPITILMPEYVPAMCAADLTAQAPGDGAWDVTEDAVRARMMALDPNVNFVFVIDGNQTGQRLLTTPSGQSPRTPGFDADVDFIAFPTGTWAFLDGGQLDLGIIRDSTLSATNKFQTFYEGWEAVAQLAPFSYRVTISLCASGGSQAAQNIAVCSPQGS